MIKVRKVQRDHQVHEDHKVQLVPQDLMVNKVPLVQLDLQVNGDKQVPQDPPDPPDPVVQVAQPVKEEKLERLVLLVLLAPLAPLVPVVKEVHQENKVKLVKQDLRDQQAPQDKVAQEGLLVQRVEREPKGVKGSLEIKEVKVNRDLKVPPVLVAVKDLMVQLVLQDPLVHRGKRVQKAQQDLMDSQAKMDH